MGYKMAWHFSDGYLGYDRRNEQIKPGNAYACKPDELRLCDFGFHSSYKLLDALKYAPGSVLSYCEIGGLIIESHDKNVSSIRRHLVVADITRTLHEFAVWCAEQALLLVDEPDHRSVEALRVKRLWLDGKATDTELAAVRVDLDDAIRTANHVADAAYRAVDAAVRDAQETQLRTMVLLLPEFAGIAEVIS